jgi:hypothetical protein
MVKALPGAIVILTPGLIFTVALVKVKKLLTVKSPVMQTLPERFDPI